MIRGSANEALVATAAEVLSYEALNASRRNGLRVLSTTLSEGIGDYLILLRLFPCETWHLTRHHEVVEADVEATIGLCT